MLCPQKMDDERDRSGNKEDGRENGWDGKFNGVHPSEDPPYFLHKTAHRILT
jgi:hypothetical protein